jgi:hypothetical protein
VFDLASATISPDENEPLPLPYQETGEVVFEDSAATELSPPDDTTVLTTNFIVSAADLPGTIAPETDTKEATTTLDPPIVTTVHPDQEEVFRELTHLWAISEGLDEDQAGLKASLASLVHLTYARVYDLEPQGTLKRLKVLLKQLRTRLAPVTNLKRRKRREVSNEELSSLEDNGLIPLDIGEKDAYEITHHNDLEEKWISHKNKSNNLHSEYSSTSAIAAIPFVVEKAGNDSDRKNGGAVPPVLFNLLKVTDSNNTSSNLETTTEYSSTVDDIVQSIIAVLNESPSNKPSYAPSPVELLVGMPLEPAEIPELTPISSQFSTSTVNPTTEIAVADSSPPAAVSTPSMMNNTMERIVMVMSIFSNLSNASRTTLLLVIVVAGVSGLLGYFAMGAPIAFIGGLAVILTLLFIAGSVQGSPVGKSKEGKEGEAESIHRIIQLISEAVKMYKD